MCDTMENERNEMVGASQVFHTKKINKYSKCFLALTTTCCCPSNKMAHHSTPVLDEYQRAASGFPSVC